MAISLQITGIPLLQSICYFSGMYCIIQSFIFTIYASRNPAIKMTTYEDVKQNTNRIILFQSDI